MNLDLDELGRDMTDKIRMDRRHRRVRQSSILGGAKSWWRALLLVGIWTLILILVYVLFLRADGGDPSGNFSAFQARLNKVEEKLARLEGQFKRSQRASKKPDESIGAETSRDRYHTVSYGDTLSEIASQYGLTVQELCRLNQITPKAVIREGQKLLITP